jgi:hypothetical protein
MDATTRRLDQWFVLVVSGGFVVVAEVLAGLIAFQERWMTRCRERSGRTCCGRPSTACGMANGLARRSLVSS